MNSKRTGNVVIGLEERVHLLYLSTAELLYVPTVSRIVANLFLVQKENNQLWKHFQYIQAEIC